MNFLCGVKSSSTQRNTNTTCSWLPQSVVLFIMMVKNTAVWIWEAIDRRNWSAMINRNLFWTLWLVYFSCGFSKYVWISLYSSLRNTNSCIRSLPVSRQRWSLPSKESNGWQHFQQVFTILLLLCDGSSIKHITNIHFCSKRTGAQLVELDSSCFLKPRV